MEALSEWAISDEIVAALLQQGVKVNRYDWHVEIESIIDLLTDDELPEVI